MPIDVLAMAKIGGSKDPVSVVGAASVVFVADASKTFTEQLFSRFPKAFEAVVYNEDNPMVCEFGLKPEYKDACVMARGYALGPEDTETIVTQVEDLVKKGFVEEVPGSEHPQVLSPAFLVSKADGGKRMVVDYGKLNKLCAPCALPLPLMEPLLESLAKCKWKSKMDLQNGFWQVRLAERCQKLTSFILPNQAVYRFRVLPMGLAVSPGVFQM